MGNITVYHYANLGKWSDIQKGSYKTNYVPGLSCTRRMGQKYVPAWQTGAAFALFEPEPLGWVNNSNFPGIWEGLMENVGSLLLEIDVDTHDPTVFVTDWGYMEGFLRTYPGEIPRKYLSESRSEAEQKYFERKCSLSKFLETKPNFSLPEVVFTNEVIPFHCIRISDYQPKSSPHLIA